MQYKVVDNFLDPQDFEQIKNTMLDYNFPWYFQDQVNPNHTEQDKDFYLTHSFYEHTANSNFYPVVEPLIKKIPAKAFLRIKGNSYPNGSILKANKPHVDYDFEHGGVLFSINTCDGYTTLDDGTKIDSVANRALFFNAGKLHASSNTTNAVRRVNININYL